MVSDEAGSESSSAASREAESNCSLRESSDSPSITDPLAWKPFTSSLPSSGGVVSGGAGWAEASGWGLGFFFFLGWTPRQIWVITVSIMRSRSWSKSHRCVNQHRRLIATEIQIKFVHLLLAGDIPLLQDLRRATWKSEVHSGDSRMQRGVQPVELHHTHPFAPMSRGVFPTPC